MQDLVADSVSGLLEDAEARALEEHLSACAACQAYAQALQREDERLAALVGGMGETVSRGKTRAIAAVTQGTSSKQTGTISLRRRIMTSRAVRLSAAAAAIGTVTFGAWTFLPFSSRPDSKNGRWWLGSTAWAQEVTEALDKVEVLTYREQPVLVGRYGSSHVSGSWRKYYVARDRRRMDQYYNETKVSSRWYVPEGQDLVQTDVSYEYQCYTKRREKGGAYQRDPVQRLRSCVQRMDKAERQLGTRTFEGRECVGFEISASKYGSNPKEWIDRIWFDVKTKLPVRIEEHGRPITNRPEKTSSEILHHFEYHAKVPAELFTPVIPEGFINTHPDNVRKAREKKEKGEMSWADIPPELKRDVMAALRKIRTVVYMENDAKVSVSRQAWRRDSHHGDRLCRTEWSVIEKADPAETSFDFNDTDFRLTQTLVDYEHRTFKRIKHDRTSRPRHPMDSILSQASLIDRADRKLKDSVIEGYTCFGVEVSAKKYGTNPDGMLHRLWFDAATKLPVRLEFEMKRSDGRTDVLRLRDRFQWDPDLPADTFVPKIPQGFTEVRGK